MAQERWLVLYPDFTFLFIYLNFGWSGKQNMCWGWLQESLAAPSEMGGEYPSTITQPAVKGPRQPGLVPLLVPLLLVSDAGEGGQGH